MFGIKFDFPIGPTFGLLLKAKSLSQFAIQNAMPALDNRIRSDRFIANSN